MRALIVEDNLCFQKCLYEALQAHDPKMVILTAADGSGLIEKIETHRPAVVFLDVQLPGANGLHLTRELRKARVDVFIVVMTSNGEPEYGDAALAAGATEFFHKDQLSQQKIKRILDGVSARAA